MTKSRKDLRKPRKILLALGSKIMSEEQPGNNLTQAVTLLNTLLSSADNIRALSNAVNTGHQQVATSSETVESRLAALFPSRHGSNLLPSAIPNPGNLRNQVSVPRYEVQRWFLAWTSGKTRKR